MLVAFVQGVVGTFDKHFRPLQDGGSEEPSQRAKDHLLEKRGVHSVTGSTEGAIHLPESPLFRLHNPDAEEQIRERMRKDA
jgi:hypothetical protein